MSKYTEKAKDSFKTKLELYLFSMVLKDVQPCLDSFKDFKIEDDMVHKFANIYWQELPDIEIDCKKISFIEKELAQLKDNSKTLIKEFEKYYVENEFPKLFPITEFNKMLKSEECFYCGITKIQIEELGGEHLLSKKTLRGWNLEIDRKTANYEYTSNNCVMSCYWCNNAKTDEFNAEEFKPIGMLIGETLRKRLNK